VHNQIFFTLHYTIDNIPKNHTLFKGRSGNRRICNGNVISSSFTTWSLQNTHMHTHMLTGCFTNPFLPKLLHVRLVGKDILYRNDQSDNQHPVSCFVD